MKKIMALLLCFCAIFLFGCQNEPEKELHADSLYTAASLEEVFTMASSDERLDGQREADGSVLVYYTEPPQGFVFDSMWSTSYSSSYHYDYKNAEGKRFSFSWTFGTDGEEYLQNSLQYGIYSPIEGGYIQLIETEYGEEAEVIFSHEDQFFKVFLPQELWEETKSLQRF